MSSALLLKKNFFRNCTKKIMFIHIYFFTRKKLAKYGSIKLQIQTLINGILDMGSDCRKLDKIK